jgi:hypothetical protein
MSLAGAMGARLWLASVLGMVSTGCSFLFERPPPSAPSERNAHAAQKCDPNNWVFPLADAASAVAGATWVVHANQQIADSGPQTVTTPDGSSYTTAGSGGSNSTYKAERIAGYSIIGVFGASAVYGTIVEFQCLSLRTELKHRKDVEHSPKAMRLGFPTSVLGFGFDATAQQAAQTCASKGGAWASAGTVGPCTEQRASVANPNVELEFELGVPSKITVIYPALPDQMNKNYAELSASVQALYGAPQTDARFSPACQRSLAQCLENDEQPSGAEWHWAAGSIELEPVWQTDHALLELRYSRSEAEGE